MNLPASLTLLRLPSRRPPLPLRLLALAGWSATFCFALSPATAQAADTIFYQRGGALYSASGEDASATARRLLTLPSGVGTLWDVSPDGRRIAWLTRSGATAIEGPKGALRGMKARPAALFVADRTGRRQKRILATDALRDRQGRKVIGLSASAPGSPDAESLPGGLDAWEPVSLCYSADGKTLYISCISSVSSVTTTTKTTAPPTVPVASDGAIPAVPTPAAAPSPQRSPPATAAPSAPNRATFAVDAATGTAVVDAQGRWKSFAPITDVDAAGTLLAGLGRQARVEPNETTASPPLTVVNLAEGKVTPLVAPRPAASQPPLWTGAGSPAIAPGAARVAFVSANARKGLWLTDPAGKTYRRLLSGDVARPRWGTSAARIYYLAPRPSPTERAVFDLYVIDAPATLTPPAPGAPPPAAPRLVLQNVEWFDIAAD